MKTSLGREIAGIVADGITLRFEACGPDLIAVDLVKNFYDGPKNRYGASGCWEPDRRFAEDELVQTLMRLRVLLEEERIKMRQRNDACTI